MSDLYSKPSISGYNSNPPSDDGQNVAANEITWAGIKTKLVDPVKTLLDSVNTNTDTLADSLFGKAVTEISSATNLATGDYGKLIVSTNATTLTLLSGATAGSNFIFSFRNNDSSAAFTLGRNGANINGAASDLVIGAGESGIAQCDGTNWWVSVNSSGVEVGDTMQSLRTSKAGWLLLYGQTIGSASSGADSASSIYEALYTVLWDNCADAECPVSSGRGASAAADWAANKTLTLPDGRGRVLLGKDNMGGSSANVVTNASADTLGDLNGAETHTLTSSESGLPAHSHGITMYAAGSTTNFVSQSAASPTGGSSTTQANSAANASSAHNNMQPYLTTNTFIKY